MMIRALTFDGMIRNWTRFSFALLLAAALALPLNAQTAAPDKPADQLRTLSRDELDVVKVVTQQERAWNDGDLDAFAKGYKNTPDIVFIGEHISKGFADMLNEYKKNYPNRDAMGTLTYSELEPHILDEHYAVLVGKYRLDRNKKAGGSAEGFFSLVFEKTDKGWKIVLDHTT
jgi:uncharacterized protein (TIGR02246 family)